MFLVDVAAPPPAPYAYGNIGRIINVLYLKAYHSSFVTKKESSYISLTNKYYNWRQPTEKFQRSFQCMSCLSREICVSIAVNFDHPMRLSQINVIEYLSDDCKK